ncbi:MAG: M28 family peptidase [bacterium]|nr:M28 family peptidase [bacterium]
MQRAVVVFLILILVPVVAYCGTLEDEIKGLSLKEMQSVVQFLGDDLLEGRAPGTRGNDLAEIYMRSLFKFMNFEPGIGDSYMQPFTLKGFTAEALTINAGGIDLKFPEDIVGSFLRPQKSFQLEGDLVFVGFGITTELWNWDDYKDVDVKDKIAIVRVNDPGMYIPGIFEGKILTYFGRWTYHIEEAARRGAAGILLIHTDASAGYDWNVVKNSWTGEDVHLEAEIKNNLKYRGWIREECFKKILDTKKISLDKLYKKSLTRSFKPVDPGIRVKIEGKNSFRDVSSNNVVAIIPGKSKKKIVLSAHIDHLGMDPNKKGDNIYNGAMDNGSAVAAMMMTAKVLAKFRDDLHYTIVLLACNAEESGLMGARYFARNVSYREDIIANINFESTPVWGKATDFMGIGARFSTLEDMLKTIVEKEGLTYSYFSLSNQGFFYRSDQYSFARYGIPSMWISAGENDDSGKKKYPAFWMTEYHTVKDEYDPKWTLEGLRQTVKITLLLLDHMNKTKTIPKWKGKLTFPIEKLN